MYVLTEAGIFCFFFSIVVIFFANFLSSFFHLGALISGYVGTFFALIKEGYINLPTLIVLL